MREIGNKTGPDTLILKYHVILLRLNSYIWIYLKKRKNVIQNLFSLNRKPLTISKGKIYGVIDQRKDNSP